MRITLIKKKEYPELKKLHDAFEVVKHGEICVAVGGDGTFIRAAREFSGPILPIRSDEKGSIGYYSDLSIGDLDYVVSNLKRGRFFVERLANKIEITYRKRRYYAVNEAALNNTLEEVSFRLYEIANGKRYLVYPFIMSGDGVLITSVVGSTAYNKSAGGPIILSPDVFCITFLNIDGPYKNPIVVDAKKELEVEIAKYRGKLRCDGEDLGILGSGDSFRVRLSDKELNIVRFRGKKEDFGYKLERIIRSRMER